MKGRGEVEKLCPSQHRLYVASLGTTWRSTPRRVDKMADRSTRQENKHAVGLYIRGGREGERGWRGGDGVGKIFPNSTGMQFFIHIITQQLKSAKQDDHA